MKNEERFFTVYLSNDTQRSIKAKSPDIAYIRVLSFILTREMDNDILYIVDEKDKKVYYDLEWAVIMNDGDSLERISGNPPTYTEREVLDAIVGYCKYIGNIVSAAENYFNTQVKKK